MRPPRTRDFSVALFLFAVSAGPAAAQTTAKVPLTFDWVFGDSAAAWPRSRSSIRPRGRGGRPSRSNGGYITLGMMTRSTEFKAGIAVAPVTDWRFYDSKWSEALLGLPDEHPALYDSASVVLRAGQLHGRLLIAHGSCDDNVHPQNEQAFIEALVKAGKMFELMVYPMRKHDIGDRPASDHLYRTMIEFWKRSL